MKNDMNLFEVVTDLSIGIDNYLKSLLGDSSKQCNL